MKKKSQLFQLRNFEKEEEIQRFLKENLTTIFPNLCFLAKEWHIPSHETHKKSGKIDALGFSPNKQGNWGNIVIIECKWEDLDDPLQRVKKYHSYLTSDEARNAHKLQKTYNNFLINQGKPVINWNLNKTSFTKKLWENPILICIAPFDYFETNHYDDSIERGIILIEIQKYESDENNLFVVSLAKNSLKLPKLKKTWEKWKKTLGLETESIIISILKKGRTTIDRTEKTPKITNEKPLKLAVTEIDTEKSELEQFLDEKKIDDKLKDKVRKLDKEINKKLKGRAIGERNQIRKGKNGKKGSIGFFVYYYGKRTRNNQLLYFLLQVKEQRIILQDNPTTKELREEIHIKGGSKTPKEKFTRFVDISNQEKYKNFKNNVLPEYLEIMKTEIISKWNKTH